MTNKKASRPQKEGGGHSSSDRPGTLRGMVRRTLGDKDLKSLRAGFSMKKVFGRSTLYPHQDGEGGEPKSGREGAEGHSDHEIAMMAASSVPSPPSTSLDGVGWGGGGGGASAVAEDDYAKREEEESKIHQSPAAIGKDMGQPSLEEKAISNSKAGVVCKGSSNNGGSPAISTRLIDGENASVKRENSAGVAEGPSDDDAELEALIEAAERKGGDGTETLSRKHPIFDLLRLRKEKGGAAEVRLPESVSPEMMQTTAVEGGVPGKAPLSNLALPSTAALAASTAGQLSSPPQGGKEGTGEVQETVLSLRDIGRKSSTSDGPVRMNEAYVDRIVLKFTTYSQSNEASSYIIEKTGGTIGREQSNTVAIPSDTTLESEAHAYIDYKDGTFYLRNRGASHCAAMRIGVGTGQREWPLHLGSAFSAGNSIFIVKDLSDGVLIAEVIDGPLKGERRKVTKTGATLGRSPDNTLSISDPELSRRHSKIEFDDSDGKYYLCDVGSTNGTYMQLVGPYNGVFKLMLSDQIMVGRTGFSINRFDFGISEEKGRRKTMEDHTLVIQDLGVKALKRFGLAPQTFAAVFDGHGGEYASAYLSTHLHINLTQALEEAFSEPSTKVSASNMPSQEEIDAIVTAAVSKAFVKTDEDFLTKGDHAEAGSTATTILIMGKRIYSCNVGDSRTILCRERSLSMCSKDHKPAREDEAKRIREAGGFIFQNRVMGELAVSRAFGDKELKKSMREIMGPEELQQMSLRDSKSDGETIKDYSKPLLIARPEILVSDLTDKDDFILLACDGLFDVFSNNEVIDFMLAEMAQHHDSQRACENLSHTAIHKRIAHDNVSIVLVVLNKWW